jgi:hypothetical protein
MSTGTGNDARDDSGDAAGANKLSVITLPKLKLFNNNSSSSSSDPPSIDSDKNLTININDSFDDLGDNSGEYTESDPMKIVSNFKFSMNLQNILNNGVYKNELKNTLNKFRDDILQYTEDVISFPDKVKELTDSSNRMANYEKGNGENHRIKLVICYVLEMIKSTNLKVPDDRVGKEIFELVMIPYMKSLPTNHPHNWDNQRIKDQSKIYGYQEAMRSGRCLRAGVTT